MLKILRKNYRVALEKGESGHLRKLIICMPQRDIVNVIRASRVRWLGHVARMEEQRVPNQMMD